MENNRTKRIDNDADKGESTFSRREFLALLTASGIVMLATSSCGNLIFGPRDLKDSEEGGLFDENLERLIVAKNIVDSDFKAAFGFAPKYDSFIVEKINAEDVAFSVFPGIEGYQDQIVFDNNGNLQITTEYLSSVDNVHLATMMYYATALAIPETGREIKNSESEPIIYSGFRRSGQLDPYYPNSSDLINRGTALVIIDEVFYQKGNPDLWRALLEQFPLLEPVQMSKDAMISSMLLYSFADNAGIEDESTLVRRLVELYRSSDFITFLQGAINVDPTIADLVKVEDLYDMVSEVNIEETFKRVHRYRDSYGLETPPLELESFPEDERPDFRESEQNVNFKSGTRKFLERSRMRERSRLGRSRRIMYRLYNKYMRDMI